MATLSDFQLQIEDAKPFVRTWFVRVILKFLGFAACWHGQMVQVLQHTEHLMRTKGHCVIVVAEGCGDTLIQSSGEKDAGSGALTDTLRRFESCQAVSAYI